MNDHAPFSSRTRVSILVVVEYGLEVFRSPFTSMLGWVSILVVVEYGLEAQLAAVGLSFEDGFNPCCSGIWP